MKKTMDYKKSGVDIEKADRFVQDIKSMVKKTQDSKVLGSWGGFSGFYKLNDSSVLVSSTDGVGTKLLLAKLLGKLDTVGIDLVAMCVNDVITCGAKPLFFLDYLNCFRNPANCK